MTEADRPATVDRILVEVTIAASAADVWDAIRDQDKIHNWFGWDAATLKDEIDFIFNKYARADEAARVLYFEGSPDRFEVEAKDGDTAVLRIIRAAPAEQSWDGIYEDMVEGWISFAQQLRLAMEKHRLGRRRTLYLSGNAKEGGMAPIAALGLAELRATQDGKSVAITLPTGEAIDGRLWHRTSWQLGLTVPQWGDGLLIVTDKSVTDTAPYGRGMVILTTYGFTDVMFDELEARWTSWWNARYETPPPTDAPCS